jgi:hypothetical protein
MSAKGMPKAELAETLARNASEINRLHAEITAAAQTSLEKSIEAGLILIAIKKGKLVAHGDWATWLDKNCPDVGATTARLYMRVADDKNRAKLEAAAAENGNGVADLSLRGAAKILSKPRGPRAAPKVTPAITIGASSPDLKDLLQSTSPNEIRTALKQADKLAELITTPLQGQLSALPIDDVADALVNALEEGQLRDLVTQLSAYVKRLDTPSADLPTDGGIPPYLDRRAEVRN